MIQVSLIATLVTAPSTSGVELTSLPDSVDWLEVRTDLVGDIDPDWIRDRFKGRIQYSLRSRAEGGNCSDSVKERHRRLISAVRCYDRVELEGNTDFSQSLLDKISVEKRLVSWHGPASGLSEIRARFDQLSSVPASNYKIVTFASKLAEEFTALSLLESLDRTDTIAYSIGPLGFWSSLAALHLGSPAIFGLVPGGTGIPSEPTIDKLIDDYGLPELMPATELFAIVGSPVFHSLSPRLHNAAYRAMNYPALFVPLHVESFEEFWQEVVQTKLLDSLDLPLNGMTVASPNKEMALQSALIVSPMARRAESANVLLRDNGWWKADTTDPEVIFMADREGSIKVKDKRAAVIGCGGAGRAIAAALVQSGAEVTLINRGADRGNHAAELLGLPYLPLPDFKAMGYDILVNATPLGRDTEDLPFALENLNDEVVVIDLVYGSRPTALIGGIRARELTAIDGRNVLLTQVRRQFRMMTGREMPVTLAMDTLGMRDGNESFVRADRSVNLNGNGLNGSRNKGKNPEQH
jgi:3-dehydroquinate dehydratase/shikimate dehydrogenase